jgi:polyhydroxybutyrate depolymerase
MVNKVPPHLALFALVAALLTMASASLKAAEYHDRLETGDRERRFMLVIPDRAPKDQPLPTVIALHGGLMNGKSMRRIFGMDGLAEQDGFAVAYPDGLRRRWNDGVVGRREGPDDVRFIRRLAQHLVESGVADPKRLYLVGISNGGMMAYRVACEAPGMFAAYAAVLANLPSQLGEECRAKSGTPLIIINSTEDPVIPFEGGDVSHWSRDEVLSTRATVDFWRRRNGCNDKSQVKPLPDRDGSDGSTVMAEQFSDCGTGAPVVVLTVEGGGHLPPGAKVGNRPMLRSMLGRANQDISAADVSWKFFRRFPLPSH